MRVLHLTLKKQWFDMIAIGEKGEEYREIKPYWMKRIEGREYDVVQFRNGYAKDAPKMTVEYNGYSYGCGRPEWGAPSYSTFVLQLGKVLSTTN